MFCNCRRSRNSELVSTQNAATARNSGETSAAIVARLPPRAPRKRDTKPRMTYAPSPFQIPPSLIVDALVMIVSGSGRPVIRFQIGRFSASYWIVTVNWFGSD